MRLVGDHDHVIAVREDRVDLSLLGPELLDQGEHVSVVLAEKSAEMGGAVGADVLLGEDSGPEELLVGLLVEVLAVGHDHERPVSGLLAEHLLGEEQHRERLAGSLGVPEHAELPALLGRGVPELLHTCERVVDAEVLVVAGEQLDEPAWTVLEGYEVLDQVEHALLRAHAPDHRFQRDDSLLALGVDLLPLREVLPARRDRPHLRLRAV